MNSKTGLKSLWCGKSEEGSRTHFCFDSRSKPSCCKIRPFCCLKIHSAQNDCELSTFLVALLATCFTWYPQSAKVQGLLSNHFSVCFHLANNKPCLWAESKSRYFSVNLSFTNKRPTTIVFSAFAWPVWSCSLCLQKNRTDFDCKSQEMKSQFPKFLHSS